MPTERYDIRIQESGSRVIKRKFDQLGQAANNATRSIFLLQRALFVIGGAGILTGLTRQLDLLTNYENRLRLTSTSAANLEQVQTRLFSVANRSRSSFEAVAEIYSRTALSVRALGVSQQETIRFTESLAKASIISGASAREANAALIQLGQGLASNRLSGDELRSILEQLPFVADVIAKQLGVTRGELRKFGSDGKISAEIVLDAFKNARDEIDSLFAQLDITIGQALVVANNNFLEFLDNVDDTLGISNALGKAIISLSNNLDVLAFGLAAVGGIIAVNLGARAGSAVLGLIAKLRTQAVRSTTLLEIERLRAAAHLRRSQAALVALRVDQQQAATDVLRLRQLTALLTQTSALTGNTAALAAAEAGLASRRAALATATAGATAASNTLAAANGRLAATTAAQSTIFARLTSRMPTLAGAVGAVTNAFRGLFSLLFTNPLTAVIGTIAIATGALFSFGDRVKITEDGVVSLKDAAIASFQLISEAVQPASDLIVNAFQLAVDIAGESFNSLGSAALTAMSDVVDVIRITNNFVIGIFVATYKSVVQTFDELPQAFIGIGTSAINGLIGIFEFGLNKIKQAFVLFLKGIGDGLSLIGATNPFENLKFIPEEIGRFKNEAASTAVEVGKIFAENFNRELERDFIGEGVDAVLRRARENIAGRSPEEDTITKGARTGNENGSLTGGKKSTGPTFSGEIEKIERETAALKLNNREREIAVGLNQIETTLKRELTSAERELADTKLRALQTAQDEANLLEKINGQQDQLIIKRQTLNSLLEQGRITLEQFNLQMKELVLSQAELNISLGEGSFAEGFLLGLQEMTGGVTDFTAAAGGEFANFFQTIGNGFADTIGDAIFSTDSLKESFKAVARQGISSLVSALIKLGIQYLANEALGLGVAAASTAAGVAQAAALSAAFAPAAALVSLATSGANAVGASAGIASVQALTTSLQAFGGLPFRNGGLPSGLIRGAGTGTTDSINARVSNDEFIVNAKATRDNLETLQRINAGGSAEGSVQVSMNLITDNPQNFVENSALVAEELQFQIERARNRGDV